MKYWTFGIVIGALIAGAAVLLETSMRDGGQFSASYTIKERLVFNEYWEEAPEALKQAEVVRSHLKTGNENQPLWVGVAVLEALDQWFRLLDNQVFKFIVDAALDTASIEGDARLYAEVNEGYYDGLSQRSVTLTVVADSESSAIERLSNWVANIKYQGRQKSRVSLISWLERKASSFESYQRANQLKLIEQSPEKFQYLSDDFKQSAEKFPQIDPFINEEFDPIIKVLTKNDAFNFAVIIILGALVGALVVLGLKLKRR